MIQRQVEIADDVFRPREDSAARLQSTVLLSKRKQEVQEAQQRDSDCVHVWCLVAVNSEWRVNLVNCQCEVVSGGVAFRKRLYWERR